MQNFNLADFEWEDRGPAWFDPATTSSVAKVSTYCKDIRGCGVKDYRSVSAAVTLNYLDGCTPRLNGVLSVSGLFFQNASATDLNTMWGMLQAPTEGGAGLLAAASTSCG